MNVLPFKVTLEALLSNGASYVGTRGGCMLVRENDGSMWESCKALQDRIIMSRVSDDVSIDMG